MVLTIEIVREEIAYDIESMVWSLLGTSRPYIEDLVKTHTIWMVSLQQCI